MTRGRPQSPILWYGPVAQFAEDLRELRQKAGVTYEKMAEAGDCQKNTLSQAANGRKLPTHRVLRTYLAGCGIIDQGQLTAWDARLRAADQQAATFAPGLGTSHTVAELAAELRRVIDAQDPPLSAAEMHERLTRRAGRTVDRLTVEALSPQEIAAVLTGDDTVTLTGRILGNLLLAAGATPDDITRWLTDLDRIEAAAGPAEDSTARATNGGSTAASGDDPTPVPTDDPTEDPTSVPTPGHAREAAGRPARDSRRWHRRTRSRRGRLVTTIVTVLTATVLTTVLTATGLLGATLGGGATWFQSDQAGDREPGTSDENDGDRGGPPADLVFGITARDKLSDLATALRLRSEPPQAGRYTYTHVRIWTRETTPTGGEAPDSRYDERLWWADDRSGRHVRTIFGPHPKRVREESFGPGGLPIDPAPPTNPVALQQRLAPDVPLDSGTAGWLRAVADLHHRHVLSPAQRAAVLELVSRLPGLTYHGTRVDRDGRSGFAVSAEDPEETAASATRDTAASATQETLIFHAETGALLGQETTLVSGPLVTATFPAGSTITYVLFVAQYRMDEAG